MGRELLVFNESRVECKERFLRDARTCFGNAHESMLAERVGEDGGIATRQVLAARSVARAVRARPGGRDHADRPIPERDHRRGVCENPAQCQACLLYTSPSPRD